MIFAAVPVVSACVKHGTRKQVVFNYESTACVFASSSLLFATKTPLPDSLLHLTRIHVITHLCSRQLLIQNCSCVLLPLHILL